MSPKELAALNKAVMRKLDWEFLPCITLMLFMRYSDKPAHDGRRMVCRNFPFLRRLIHISSPGKRHRLQILSSYYHAVYLVGVVSHYDRYASSHPAMGVKLCHFLVGATEGPFLPVITLMTSPWYTKEESPPCMGIWHADHIISNVFSGLMAAGILTNMDDIAGLHAWQWFLLLEGVVSILVAIVRIWLLPNFPNNTGTYFFTEEEQQMSQYCVLVSAGGKSEDDGGDMVAGAWMAVKNPSTWFFAGMHFALVIAQSFKDFFPSIVGTLGFGTAETYLAQALPYVIAYIVTLIVSWSSGRMLEHCWHIVGSISFTLIGAVLMISTLNVGACYFSLILLCSGPFVGLNIQLSWETTAVPSPRTKRVALLAIANSVSNVSHWSSPYFFLRSQEPRYQMGGGIIIAGCGLAIIFCPLARFWSTRKNNAIDRGEERSGDVTTYRFAT